MIFNKFRKKAYTLAEMLIALAIVGVIATISINTLNRDWEKKELAIGLQRTYESITKAVANGIVENGPVEGWDFSLTTDELIKKYLSTLMITGSEKIGDKIVLTLDKGVQITTQPKDDRLDFWIDVNGFKRGRGEAGFDIFAISLTQNGEVLLPTWDESGKINKDKKTTDELAEDANYGCNPNANRYWCAALIQRNGWKITDKYWKKLINKDESESDMTVVEKTPLTGWPPHLTGGSIGIKSIKSEAATLLPEED